MTPGQQAAKKWGVLGKAITELVDMAVAEAVKEEREACAKLAEQDSTLDWRGGSTGDAKGTSIKIAAAIRARG